VGLDELRLVLSGARAGTEALSRLVTSHPDLVEQVRRDVRRAEEVLDALLALEAADRPLSVHEVDLNDLAAVAVERVACDLGPDDRIDIGELPRVRGDASALLPLVSVLMENAVKYRRPDVDLRIRLGSYPSGPEVVIEVEDNGHGVPDGYHDEVLRMYEAGLEDREPGAGIGLAACRRIVEAHGGTIWLEPVASEGTLVAFTLPRVDDI
jgi:signal transduction histidine kinase